MVPCSRWIKLTRDHCNYINALEIDLSALRSLSAKSIQTKVLSERSVHCL